MVSLPEYWSSKPLDFSLGALAVNRKSPFLQIPTKNIRKPKPLFIYQHGDKGWKWLLLEGGAAGQEEWVRDCFS
jgi:hypothetical protein